MNNNELKEKREECRIQLKNVSLLYDLHYDKTTDFKDFIISRIIKRKYVDKRKDTLAALNNITLDINHGERLGVIGLNGAGKSTLLKVVSNILKPTNGTISVTGNVQTLIEISAGFNPEFSGRENIYFNGYMLGFSKKQIKAKEKEIIEFTELGDFIDVPIKYYSSGMSIRLAFTIATMIEPEILIFDEMLSAGDIHFMDKAKNRINNLVSIAKILIVVSHDLELIKSLAKRLIVLHNGSIYFDGDVDTGIQKYLELARAK